MCELFMSKMVTDVPHHRIFLQQQHKGIGGPYMHLLEKIEK